MQPVKFLQRRHILPEKLVCPLECADRDTADPELWVLCVGVRSCVHTRVCREGQVQWEGAPVSLPLAQEHVGKPCAMLMALSLILTVKKKCSPGLKLSNLMNLGRKKSALLEPPERSLETSSENRARPLDRGTCALGCSPSPGRQWRPGRPGI